jgi:hypothetical protein
LNFEMSRRVRIVPLLNVAIWLYLVGRSGIFSEDLSSKMFWINFLLFLGTGIGIISTTNFLAGSIPLSIGILLLTPHTVKGGWALLNLYIVAAIVIGFFSIIFKLASLGGRNSDTVE